MARNAFSIASVNVTASSAPTSFVQRIRHLIEGARKTQRQIAVELGYGHPNIITVFNHGDTRVPVGKVACLARSLGADPGELLLLWLSDYEPALLKDIEAYLWFLCSPAERDWIEGQRQHFPDGLPAFEKIKRPEVAAA